MIWKGCSNIYKMDQHKNKYGSRDGRNARHALRNKYERKAHKQAEIPSATTQIYEIMWTATNHIQL